MKDSMRTDSGKRRCMFIDASQTPHPTEGYIPSLVVEDDPGHRMMTGATGTEQPWYWGDLATAEKVCADYNLKTFGVDEKEALEIVLSSMGASFRGR